MISSVENVFLADTPAGTVNILSIVTTTGHVGDNDISTSTGTVSRLETATVISSLFKSFSRI